MPSADQVADRARSYSERGTYWGVGMCLKFSRTSAGAPGGTYNAITAWRNAKHRHLVGVPPRGSFVFWEGGSSGHGHVAVSDRKGYIWTTDLMRKGKVDRVSIAYLGARWPLQHYLGWAEDVNGVRVSGLGETTAASTAESTVTLANLQPGDRHEDVRALQLALRRKGYGRLNPSGVTGYYGTETRAMCRAFQESLGWSRWDANGVPGPKTCALLGLIVR